jgi:hypothetical protein
MNRIFTCAGLIFLALSANAQKAPTTQSYGKVDKADLEMKVCDFEKDANAEVLFDKASVAPEGTGARTTLTMERHVRLKVFNDFGKNVANVRILYFSYLEDVAVTNLQAETINLNNDKLEITTVDKKNVYTEKVDKLYSAMVFSFPNVKPGSIIEYKYRVASRSFPTWYFQDYVPTRYSEIEINIPSFVNFKTLPHIKQQYLKSVGVGSDAYQVRVMSNVHSMPNEPYMGSRNDNLQRIEYIGINTDISTWPKIGEQLMRYNDFGYDLDRNLADESTIIKKAKSLASDDEKIAYVFDEVQNAMKYDGNLHFYTDDGTVKAWDKKVGNSAEINMIVYHLLKKVGIKAYPLVVCTKSNGKINPTNATMFLFNNTVVYVPIDSIRNYVLDASNKYNLFNTIPANVLNSFGLCMDPDKKHYKMLFIENEAPSMQSVYLNAEIKPGGKIEGNVEITSYAYNKVNTLQDYNTYGEKKYIDSLQQKDNTLKISSFKLENMEVDSLPLTQKINFGMDLTGSDENYIYVNPGLFNSMGANPFLSEDRFSDIDLGYRNNCSIYGIYKLPVGFKTEALPKNITIVMPDQSIIFKRIIVEDNGTVMVKYILNHKKTIYFREDYQEIRGFYKKMYELMNEQIVLKKG